MVARLTDLVCLGFFPYTEIFKLLSLVLCKKFDSISISISIRNFGISKLCTIFYPNGHGKWWGCPLPLPRMDNNYSTPLETLHGQAIILITIVLLHWLRPMPSAVSCWQWPVFSGGAIFTILVLWNYFLLITDIIWWVFFVFSWCNEPDCNWVAGPNSLHHLADWAK